MDGPPRPIVTTPPVLLTRTYRFAKKWNEGIGRHAGKILLLLPVAALLALFFLIFLINSVCLELAQFETCVTSFTILGRGGLLLLATLTLLCLASMVARFFLLAHRLRAARQAQQSLADLRKRIGGADPLTDEAYAALHERWRQDNGPDRVHRHVAHLLILPTLLLAATAIGTFLAAQKYFQQYGALFVFEFNIEPIDYWILEALFVASLYLTYRAFRTATATRRLARDAREELERELSAAEAALVRKHRDPQGSTEEAPAFTFRPWSARLPREG